MADGSTSMSDSWGYRQAITQEANGALKAPKEIINSVQSARMLYFKYRGQHLARIDLYAMIEGLIAGNPPYNPGDLEAHGLSHIANFNNGDGRAFYEKAALAYWNLLNSAETICKFNIRLDAEERASWETILAKNWDKMVRSWPDFERQTNTLSGQLVKFGISPACWTDERDWRWKTIELSRFFVSNQASTDLSQLTAVFVESNFTAQYLWDVYNTLKDKPKKDNPWNIEELEKFLLFRANTFLKQDTQDNVVFDMMDLQQRLQNRDFLYDTIFSDEIRLITMFYQEYSGKITQAIFDRNYQFDFLFHAPSLHKNISDALVLFTASPGEFTIHSNRGVGHKIFSPCQASMQIDCDIVNMTRLGSTPFIQSLTGTAQSFDPIRIVPGVINNIGGAQFVQNNLATNVNQLVFGNQFIMQKLNNNIANSGDDPGVPDAKEGSISPSQAKMKSFREFNVLKHNVHHFYSKYDGVFKNMLRKQLACKPTYPGYDAVKQWKEECIEEGVPELVFATRDNGEPRFLSIKATRVAGDGSTLAAIMSIDSFAPFAPALPAKGNQEFMRRAVMAYFGKEDLSSFLPDTNPDERSGGASLAATENAIMQMGLSPVFSPDNEQRAHIVTHMALNQDTIQRVVQQEISPIDADKIFAMSIPHTGEHINFIAQNPLEQNFFESIRKAWDQVSEYARLNRKNAEEMLKAEIRKQQEQEAKTQSAMTDDEIKTFKATRDEARADFKVQSQVQRADRANDTRAEIMKEKVEKDASNQELKVRLENQVKQRAEANKSASELKQQLADMGGETPAPADIEVPSAY